MVREAFDSFLYDVAAITLCTVFCGGLLWIKKKLRKHAEREEKDK